MKKRRGSGQHRDDHALAIKAKAGDAAALNALVARWRPLLTRWVRQATKQEPEDGIGEAVLIFLSALKTWEPDRGCQLVTYVGRIIRVMLHARYKRDQSLIRLPQPQAMRKLSADLLERALQASRRGLFVDASVVRNRPATESEPKSRAIELEALEATLNAIDPREAEVLRLRAAGVTLKVIGAAMGITRERVRQIEMDGIFHARKHLGLIEGEAKPSTQRHAKAKAQAKQRAMEGRAA